MVLLKCDIFKIKVISINSLHSNMVLLKCYAIVIYIFYFATLHSNMVLLKLEFKYEPCNS